MKWLLLLVLSGCSAAAVVSQEDLAGADLRGVPSADLATNAADLASNGADAAADLASAGGGDLAGGAPDLASSIVLTGTPISPLFFGMNAWMPDYVGGVQRYGKFEKRLCGAAYTPGDTCMPAEISAAGVQIIRYGGITNDKNFEQVASYAEHKVLIENLHTLGIEPIIQVSYAAGQYTAQQAADLVTYVNVTEGLAVKYWTIANEPNLTDDPYDGMYGAAEIAEYFKEFAVAMKNADPSIVITGPDLNHYNDTIMNGLTAGTNDITGEFLGLDGNMHHYVDILNFHTYKFDGDTGVQTRQAVIDYPAGGFAASLDALAARSTLPRAVTEMNVDYKNPTYADDEAMVRGVGAQSFLAGQYWASAMNVGLRKGLSFITFWSVAEGSGIYDLGFIENATATPRSTYYHFQLMATSFRGVYAPATWLLNGNNEGNVTAFGARDLDQIVVMILNQKSATTMSYTVRLDTGTIAGSGALAVKVDAKVAAEYTSPSAEPLPPQATARLVFDATGTLQTRTIYTVEDAVADRAPAVHTD